MSTFEMFVRLSPSRQRHIVKTARMMARIMRGMFDFMQAVEVLTQQEYQSAEQRRNDRLNMRRDQFQR